MLALLPAAVVVSGIEADSSSAIAESRWQDNLPANVAAFFDPAPALPADEPEDITHTVTSALRDMATHSTIVEAIRTRNDARMALTAQEINAMGKAWARAVQDRDDRRVGNFLDAEASTILRALRDRDLPTGSRIYISDNRGLLTAATAPEGGFLVTGWEDWRRLYMSAPRTVFIEAVDSAQRARFYRVEVAVRDPANGEAVGALVAEVPISFETATKEPALTPEKGNQLHVRRP